MRKHTGRPPISEEIVVLIQRMARENRTWDAKRIRGELLKLGLRGAKSTIQRYIKQVRGLVHLSRPGGLSLGSRRVQDRHPQPRKLDLGLRHTANL